MNTPIMRVGCLLFAGLIICGPAPAEVLYQNDFGTQEQIDSWYSQVDFGGKVPMPSTDMINGTIPYPDPKIEFPAGTADDRDGDGLYQGVGTSTSYSDVRAYKNVYAPAFMVLSNPQLSAYTRARANRGAITTWDLSANFNGDPRENVGGKGVWTDSPYKNTYDGGESWVPINTLPTASDPDYTRVTKVGVGSVLYRSHTDAYEVRAASGADIMVAADLDYGLPGETVLLSTDCDFGADEDRNQWTFSGDIGAITYSTDGTDGRHLKWDRNNDDLANRMEVTGGTITAVLQIDAPAGLVFTNPVVAGIARGAAVQGAYVNVSLSLDGANWEYQSIQESGWTKDWAFSTIPTAGDYRYDSLTRLYVRIYMSDPASYITTIRDLTITGELVALSNSPRAIYVNDFGTVAQRTVGAEGEWDWSETLHGTPNLVYHENGWNGISAERTGDELDGGLSGSGDMAVRYIKTFSADEGEAFRNISVAANGHGDPVADTSFAVGLSVDGVNWDLASTNDTWVDYPDRQAEIDASSDPNYQDISTFHVMIEWNNQTAVTDPCRAAYITDVVVEVDTAQQPVLDASNMGLFRGNSKYDFDFAISKLTLDATSYTTVESRQQLWDDYRTARLAGRPYLVNIFFEEPAPSVAEMKNRVDRLFGAEGGVSTYPMDIIGVCFDEEETPILQENTVISDLMHNELYDYIKSWWPVVDVYRWYTYNIKPLSFDAGVAEKCDGYIWDDYYSLDPVLMRRNVMLHAVTGKKYLPVIWASEPGWPGGTSPWLPYDNDPCKTPEDQDLMVVNAPNSVMEQYWWNYVGVCREFGLPVCLFGVADAGNTWDWVYDIGSVSPNHTYIREVLVEPTKLDMRLSNGARAATADYSNGDGVAVNTGGAYNYTDNYKSRGTMIGLGTIYDADIRGFSRMVQVPSSSGTVVTRASNAGTLELIYRFYAPAGGLSGVSASLTGSVDPDQGGVNGVALSYDGGLEYTHLAESTPGVDTAEVLTVNGGGAYVNREAFYVHVIMDHDVSDADSPANTITNLAVTCTHDAGATPVPDPGLCGDLGYPTADIAGGNIGTAPGDCIVNLQDFAVAAMQWAECTDPANTDCD